MMMASTAPERAAGRVSVAICTHNRGRYLRECLKGLVNQTASPRDMPVIVVNNKSTDDTAEVCREFSASLNLQMLTEDRLGLSHARNAALDACETEYVVFLDDDGIPGPQWLAAIVEGVDRWRPDIFGGPYTPYYEGAKPAWFEDAFGSAHTEVPEGPVEQRYCFSGGNMGWRTELLKSVGGFDARLGMTGDQLRLGEETALQLQLWSRPELTRVMLPAMHMVHCVPPAKISLSYLWRRSFNYGRQLAEIDPSNPVWTHARMLRSAAKMKFGAPLLVRLVARDRVRYPYWRTYVGNFFALHAIHCGAAWAKLFPEKRHQ